MYKRQDETFGKIISLADDKWEPGVALRKKEERKGDVFWCNEQWIYDLIWPCMMDANREGRWEYKIVGAQDIQLTRYREKDFYSWHKDSMGSHGDTCNQGYARKLSMSMLLNSNFKGGDLEIFGAEIHPKLLNPGDLVVFPSFMHHRVTPVTEGTRYALVVWFTGPPFL